MTVTITDNRKLPRRTFGVCAKCKLPLEYRAHRSWFVKNLLFWLPIRKFKCVKCNRSQYVMINR